MRGIEDSWKIFIFLNDIFDRGNVNSKKVSPRGNSFFFNYVQLTDCGCRQISEDRISSGLLSV